MVAGADEYLARAADAGLLPPARLRQFDGTAPTVDVAAAIERSAGGGRLCAAEVTAMLEHGDLIELGAAANRRRAALNPDGVVSYIVERNINYTNICVTACRFCAFFRNPGDTEEGYVLSREEHASVPEVPASLPEVLRAVEAEQE